LSSTVVGETVRRGPVGVGEAEGVGLGDGSGDSINSPAAGVGVAIGASGGGVGGGVTTANPNENNTALSIGDSASQPRGAIPLHEGDAMPGRRENEAMARYLDEFVVGDTFESESYTLALDDSLAFAREYDPQPFHLDPDAAAQSIFREIAASGWQTAAITMRLIVLSGVLQETGIVGTGIDELRWLAPVKPGDTLRVRGEIVAKAPWPGSASRGTLRVRLETFNGDGVVVMTQFANLLVPVRRPEA
jgi:acyl dehydratase